MDIGESSDQGDDSVVNPLRCRTVKGVKGDEQGKCPKLEDDGGGNSTIDSLTEPSSKEEHSCTNQNRGNGEKVGVGRGETKVAER